MNKGENNQLKFSRNGENKSNQGKSSTKGAESLTISRSNPAPFDLGSVRKGKNTGTKLRNIQSNHSQKNGYQGNQLDVQYMRVNAIQTPRLTDSAYDSGGSAEMESFIRGMVTQLRTDYIETSEDDDQVLEEADPEQEYDEEIV